MAKEIDKIIQSKTAPKSNNVLWDDGENLKINRNGKWESACTIEDTNKDLISKITIIYERDSFKYSGNFNKDIVVVEGVDKKDVLFLVNVRSSGTLKTYEGEYYKIDIELYPSGNWDITKIVHKKPTFSSFEHDVTDYSGYEIYSGECVFFDGDVYIPAMLNYNVVSYNNGSVYEEYQLDRNTWSLTLIKSIDINSLENRIAALEAK